MGNMVYFNNRNWPHIVRSLRLWLTVTPLFFPAVFWLLRGMWDRVGLAVTLTFALGLFLPIVWVGRKYQK